MSIERVHDYIWEMFDAKHRVLDVEIAEVMRGDSLLGTEDCVHWVPATLLFEDIRRFHKTKVCFYIDDQYYENLTVVRTIDGENITLKVEYEQFRELWRKYCLA